MRFVHRLLCICLIFLLIVMSADAESTLSSAESSSFISPPDATATPAPDTDATPVPDATITPVPDATATPVPDTTATPAPDTTATPVPDATITPVPDATATPVPDATETPAPDTTETPAPYATETPAPDATATPVPDATETPAPDATETPVPDTSIQPAPNAGLLASSRPAYTITIPSCVELDSQTGTGQLQIVASGLAEGSPILYLSVSSQNQFYLVSENNALHYTLVSETGMQSDQSDTFYLPIISSGVTTLSLSLIDSPPSSGFYTDTLTFTLHAGE